MKSFLFHHWIVLFVTALFFRIEPAMASSISGSLPKEGLVMFDESSFNGSPRGFFRYDPVTNSFSLITEVPVTPDRLSGFTWHPQERRVYAGSEEGRIYTIDLLTGTVNLVGQTQNSNLFPFIRGLTFEPGTNQLLWNEHWPTTIEDRFEDWRCDFLRYRSDPGWGPGVYPRWNALWMGASGPTHGNQSRYS